MFERRGTTKGIMQIYRKNITDQRTRLQKEVDKLKADRNAELEKLNRQSRNRQELLITEKARHDRFVDKLMHVLHILKTPGGKITTYSTEWMESPASQQTFGDREHEIANILTHLPPRQAMVSTPSGEYTMKTHDLPSVSDITKKRDRVLEHTIRQYCKSRSQVEQEIVNRIRLSDPLS